MSAKYKVMLLAAVLWALGLNIAHAQVAPERQANPTASGTRWVHENLAAWEVAPYDPAIGPSERAQLLERLGFKHFVYDWHQQDVAHFDAEIAAHKRRGINILGWWWPLDLGHPSSEASLAAIARNGIRPQLWVPHAHFYFMPKTFDDFIRWWPKDASVPAVPKTQAEFRQLPQGEQDRVSRMVMARWHKEHPKRQFPKNPQEQARRVRQEADRIGAIARRAAVYGGSVALYNHGGWFGIMENQLALIEDLAGRGVTNVGMVYVFAHARDEFHDDSKRFAKLWPKIQAHVLAVSVAGIRRSGQIALPSQGDGELEMLRIIHDSGWRGPIVLSADFGAEATLRDYRTGLDWLLAEIVAPGSGGRRPFPALPADPAQP